MLLIALFTSVHSYGASFEEAVELEREGKLEEAASIYQSLLETDDKRHCEIIIRLYPLVANIGEKRDLLENSLDLCSSPSQTHEILTALASLEDLTGRIAAAQRYYQQAAFAVPDKKDFTSLMASANLLYDLGEYRNAEAQARGIQETCNIESIRFSAELLLSRIYYRSERNDKALETARNMVTRDPARISPAALLWIIELGRYLMEESLSGKAEELLMAIYPDSPEAALASGLVDSLPSPSSFLETLPSEKRDIEPDGDVEDAMVSDGGADKSGPEFVSIQTGSFSVRENADFASKDLKDAGFASEVQVVHVNSRTYYRVVIVEVPAAESNDLILKLKDKGFEGFRISD
ncbi:MAG: hypothetical protein HN368_12665 [Spirochaetales bacterium]|nr:hypothetical protein [Spirochaetales bacterium]